MLQDVNRFTPNTAKKTKQYKEIYNIKYELYRLLNLIIDHLALLLDLKSKSTWNRIVEMTEKNFGKNEDIRFLSKEGANNLKTVIDLTTKLRTQAYMQYGEQNDDLIPLDGGEDNLDLLKIKLGINRQTLFEIYFVLLPVADIIKSLCYQWSIGKKIFTLENLAFLDNGLYRRGQVYEKLQSFNEAIKYYTEALELIKQKSGENHQDTIPCIMNVGRAYGSLGYYSMEKFYYEKAFEISNDLSSGIYNDMGTVCEELGEMDEAGKYYKKAFEINI